MDEFLNANSSWVRREEAQIAEDEKAFGEAKIYGHITKAEYRTRYT